VLFRSLVELAVRLAAALRRGAQAAPALEAFRRQQDDDDD